MSPSLILYTLPYGLTAVASASKPIPATFYRPWQQDFPPPPSPCVFETPAKQEQAPYKLVGSDTENWYGVKSDFAPEDPHWLIVPQRCWGNWELRILGGEAKILDAITLATQILEDNADNPRYKGLLGFSIQVGALAGQNQRHTHYHLYRPNFLNDPDPRPLDVSDLARETDLLIFEQEGIRVVANGHYTGQAMIVPQSPVPFNMSSAPTIASVLYRLIYGYATVFQTPTQLSPDYHFELQLWNGTLHFGLFFPKLNNTGSLESHALFDHRRGWNLAWSHHETAAYLRSKCV